jgi:N-acetylmuramic acid 6-phosphate (MurNAc-6-P) etherase
MKLDRMPTNEAIKLFIFEELSIYDQILKQKYSFEILIERISTAFRSGGRLFYVSKAKKGYEGSIIDGMNTITGLHVNYKDIIVGNT